ncbi:MAG TPA: thiolase family protein [Acidimicrobiales bacterium]|nr:thiolase family protein [Acidimicrobiales bacterium]
MTTTDHPVAIVGAGYTELTRRPERSEADLAVEACGRAAEDAGLDIGDLDGINLQVHHDPPPDTPAIARRLGMGDTRWSVDGGLGVGALAVAAKAVDAGLCRAAVVCKIMNTVAPVMTPVIDPETGGVPGPGQFEVPYGLGYTMQRVGFMMRRWMHRYGITEEQVGWLTVVERRHAMLNPRAIFKEPLTLEDYCSSRWIAEPVRLLDCDYPVNGAFAYVVTRGDIARRVSPNPVTILGWAGEGIGDMIAHLRPEAGDGLNRWAVEAYRDTGLSPEDMDVWMLYDGFSFLAMQWMEQLGLVGPGESGAYVEGGERISFNGEHPVNTHGGQLSEGRLHAAGHILEAFQQVRGTAGARQAARADHAIVSSAFPYNGGVAILGRR